MYHSQIQSIKRFIVRSESGIMIVVCEQIEASVVSDLLHDEVPALRHVELPEKCLGFYDEVERCVNVTDLMPLLICGLEKTVTSPDYHPIFQDINVGRKRLKVIGGAKILLIPEYLLRPLARYCPDFRDWAIVEFL